MYTSSLPLQPLVHSFLSAFHSTNSWGGRGGGGYSHIWTIQGFAAQQGMVFASLSLEQGLQISISVWNRVYVFFAIPTLEHGQGDYVAARIAVQMNVVAVPARVPLHVNSNTPFPI